MLPTSPTPLSPFVALREGDLLGGRYRIEALAQSKAAHVQYEATDLTSGRRVIAHLLIAPGSVDALAALDGDSARVSFLAGARRAKSLTGPHVAHVFDAGVSFEGHPWIVREHIPSTTLAMHLRERGALRPTDAIEIALAVCDALAEMHGLGIVHGSLGPAAVHVAWSASGLTEVKLTGAGTAPAEAALSLGGGGEAVLRAPEQLRHLADHRADIWAAAALLYTMLAGRSPFAADTPSGASLSVLLEDPRPLENVPPDLALAVAEALQRDPKLRPRTILHFAQAIAYFAKHPDFAFDRIASRRPVLIPFAEISTPTLAIDKVNYDALSRESATRAPSVEIAFDPDADVAPSVRDLAAAAQPTPRTRAKRDEQKRKKKERERDKARARSRAAEATAKLAKRAKEASAAPQPIDRERRAREMPTRLIRRKRPNRILRALGFVSAAAAVAALVVLGTEGAWLSRRFADLKRVTTHTATPIAAAATAAPMAALDPPPALITTDEAPAVSAAPVLAPPPSADAPPPARPAKKAKKKRSVAPAETE